MDERRLCLGDEDDDNEEMSWISCDQSSPVKVSPAERFRLLPQWNEAFTF